MTDISTIFEKYADILEKVPLFEGIARADLKTMLSCVGAAAAAFPRETDIVRAGDEALNVGVVLSGQAQVFKEDAFARRNIMANLERGDVFSEVFACAGVRESPVTVTAVTEAEILFMDYFRVVRTCPNSCAFHSLLIQNMLKLLAQKNLVLNLKIDYLSIKSLRGRIAAYLLGQPGAQTGGTITVPFDRSGLADYLGADRSALSRELGRMRDEGLIAYKKNLFKILDPGAVHNLGT